MTATSCPPLAPKFRLCPRCFTPQCLNARSKYMYQQLVEKRKGGGTQAERQPTVPVRVRSLQGCEGPILVPRGDGCNDGILVTGNVGMGKGPGPGPPSDGSQ